MTGDQPVTMAGGLAVPRGRRVTLANWQDPPFNRWAFKHVRELVPSARIGRGTGFGRRLPRDEQEVEGIAFRYQGSERTVGEMLAATSTDAFMVLHRGRVVTERYFDGMTPDTPHLLMSVSKSITSTVAGILAGRGALDLRADVAGLVPELAGTSFAGATASDLLDMRAGTRFSEDYADLAADVRTYEQVYLWRPRTGPAVPGDAIGYFATLASDGPHGGPFRYRSVLTDVLALVIERVAGERLADLIAREIWQPIGAEFDAEITVDAGGNPMADGGISATLRDLARFGQLFADHGVVGQRQVVPGWWIDDTVRGAADGAAAFAAGDNPPGFRPASHYRNCWWVHDPALPFCYASGINGQHVFIHVPSGTVVVKLSAWPVALDRGLAGLTVAAVLAIAAALGSGDLTPAAAAGLRPAAGVSASAPGSRRRAAGRRSRRPRRRPTRSSSARCPGPVGGRRGRRGQVGDDLGVAAVDAEHPLARPLQVGPGRRAHPGRGPGDDRGADVAHGAGLLSARPRVPNGPVPCHLRANLCVCRKPR